MIKKFSVGTQVKYVGSDEKFQGMIGEVKSYIDFGIHAVRSNSDNRVIFLHDSEMEGFN